METQPHITESSQLVVDEKKQHGTRIVGTSYTLVLKSDVSSKVDYVSEYSEQASKSRICQTLTPHHSLRKKQLDAPPNNAFAA